jgi:hypothetical protein
VAEVNYIRNIISYSSEETTLGIPSLDDSNAIAFRFHSILDSFGEDSFQEVYNIFNSDNLEFININLETLGISEFEIWLSYLGHVSDIMGQSVKRTGFHKIVQNIFPLQNVLTKEEMPIGKRDRYPYIIELEGLSKSVKYVRAKLAIHELLFAKFNSEKHLKELSFFDKRYLSEVNSPHCDLDSFSEDFLQRVMFLNYFEIHNEIREGEKYKDIESVYKKYNLSHSSLEKRLKGKELTLEILLSKALVPNIGLRAFNKRLKHLYEIYNIENITGRPNDDFEFGEFLPRLLDGGTPFKGNVTNYCIDVEKYNLIKRRGDYLLAFVNDETEIEIEEDMKLNNEKILNLIS